MKDATDTDVIVIAGRGTQTRSTGHNGGSPWDRRAVPHDPAVSTPSRRGGD
ncbi:hypothetical protein HNR23_004362 [Nocardiopsis mwathae]|uniref:Uncharacterized protein n=1 Tax=Nocardiopsis mwathae TaxID=1472723 RepID=A0A7X0D763_9ACTN|nr:hypothetical protein [Nocardiopsis mwathae]MBB6174302.1 hypothetical protein [Nocardiopsis mwathae]